MPSSPNDLDTDAILADVDKDNDQGRSSSNQASKISSNSSVAFHLTNADKPSNHLEQSESNNANSAGVHDINSINNNSDISDSTTSSIQHNYLSFLPGTNTSSIAATDISSSDFASSHLASPPLMESGNVASSVTNQGNGLDQPRRSPFSSRNQSAIGADDLEGLLFTDENRYHPDFLVDDEDIDSYPGYGYDDYEDEEQDEEHEGHENGHSLDGEEEEEEEDGDDDDDDDDDGNDNEPTESAEYQMLQTLRNAFGMPNLLSGIRDRINPALDAISRLDDPSEVATGLHELSKLLLVNNEDTLNDALPTAKVLDSLVDILTSPLYEDNVEICIITCRCLSNLLDAVPSSLNLVSYARVVKALCEKLFEIQYIDIAELALTSLRKISRRQTTSILENGGLTACLSYIDFFSLPTQRIATETVANTLRMIPPQYFDSVKDVIPLLEGILTNHDSEIMVNVSKCISGMIISFSYSKEKVEQLATPKIIKQLFSYIDPNNANSVQVKPYIINAISSIIRVSTKTTTTALNEGLVQNIYEILTKHSITLEDNKFDGSVTEKNTSSIIQSLIYVDKNILSSSLCALENIFPRIYIKEGEATSPYKISVSSDSVLEEAKERTKALLENYNIVFISKHVMSLLLNVYSCTISLKVRRAVLQTILKVVSMLTPDLLRPAVKDLDLSLLLSSILAQKDQLSLVYGALDIAEILLNKLPDIYLVSFFRGGIINEIRSMAEDEEYAKLKKEMTEHLQGVDTYKRDDNSFKELESADNSQNENEEDDEEISHEMEHDAEEDNDDELDYHESESIQADIDEEIAEGISSTRITPSINTQPKFSSSAKFYTELRPHIYDKSGSIVNDYNIKLQSRNMEEEMEKGMSVLKSIGQQLLLHNDLVANFEKLASIIDEVSEFELLCSKVLRNLLEVLTIGTGEQIRSTRKAFLQAFIQNGNTKAFEVLIERLNDSLNRFEQFEVLTSQSDGFSGSLMSSLDRQFRIILKPKVDSDVSPTKTYKPIMISIQAIASLKAINEFYKSKVRAENGIFGSRTKLFSDLLEATVVNDSSWSRHTTQTREEPVEDTPSEIDVEMTDAPASDDDNDDSILPNFNSRASTTENQNDEDTNLRALSSNSTSNPDASDTDDNEETHSLMTFFEPSPCDYHLEFYIDDQLISHETPIFGAVYQSLMRKEQQKAIEKAQAENRPVPKVFSPRLPMQSIWMTPHKISFKKVIGPYLPTNGSIVKESLIDPDFGVPVSFASSESVAIVIRLLRILYDLNLSLAEYSVNDQQFNHITTSKFTNSKLTAKLNKQLGEPLIVVSNVMPAWVIDGCRSYPFLFPFETRLQFLQSTSFGYWRSLHKLQQDASDQNGNGSRIQSRLVRQKIRIKRVHMLQSAIKVMNHYGSSPCVIEIEFFEDVGTGLGPTLEFYATVSKLFTRKKLGLWRDDNGDSNTSFAFSSQGLFPKPHSAEYLSTPSGKKVISTFRTLGIFVARALLDCRILDLNFNPLFFKLLQDIKRLKDVQKHVVDETKLVDRHLYNSLRFLERFGEAKIEAFKNPDPDARKQALNAIQVDGVQIGSLALDFTYPGDSELKMVADAEKIDVDMENIEEYIENVTDFTLGTGIFNQLEAFYEGFSHVFSFDAMSSFSPEELVIMCGQGEVDWSYDTLMASAQANHGYTQDSRVVQDLFVVMSELSLEERKAFLQFVTGSPNLPIGGFKALKPPFTIVCREPDRPLTPDECLPTVMTCVNYFKLPNYSSREILKERILKAIKEGSGSFMLS